jgi:hypothetical protein
MTYEEILEVLKSKIETVSHFAVEDYNISELGLGPIVEVKQHGGSGMGDIWYSVKYFVDHDVYINVHGFYSSYEGIEFEDWDSACSNVKPVTKSVVFYE